MAQNLALVAVVVDEYDSAIDFFTRVLGFDLIEDTPQGGEKRWVVVAPKGSEKATGCRILIARAVGEEQKSRVGNQTGGRVFLFLHTDDFDGFYQKLVAEKVEIVRPMSVEAFGKVAVFRDPFGNLWDLIEPKKTT